MTLHVEIAGMPNSECIKAFAVILASPICDEISRPEKVKRR
jgi:hypothetical protein